MPRARNPNRDKAYELWCSNKSNIKLKDIATKLGETESTIRKWKCTDKWEEKQKGTLSKKKGNAPKGKRGAPKGNTNSVGHGAPPGNKNAVTHGGYTQIYWDTLSDDERALIDTMETDEEFLLLEQIRVCTVRERRLMIALNKYESQSTPLAVDCVLVTEHKRQFENSEKGILDKELYEKLTAEKIDKGEKLPGRDQQIITRAENTIGIVTRLQTELTKVQRVKNKCLDSLFRIHNEKEKLELIRESNDIEIEDTSEIDGVIYGS